MTILEVECPHVLETWNVGGPDGMYDTNKAIGHNTGGGSGDGRSRRSYSSNY